MDMLVCRRIFVSANLLNEQRATGSAKAFCLIEMKFSISLPTYTK